MQLLALLRNEICPFGKQAGAAAAAAAASVGQFRQSRRVRGDTISDVEVCFFAGLSNRWTSIQVHVMKTQR